VCVFRRTIFVALLQPSHAANAACAVVWCPSVRPSVCLVTVLFVYCEETSKQYSQTFSPSVTTPF